MRLAPPSRAPPRPLQHARSTSSTRARGAADGHGAALDDREAAARLSAALAEEVVGLVGLLRTCGGKQRRSADRTPSVRPRRPAATTTSLWRLQAPLREMILAGTHCRALLRIALHNELNMMPSVEAEACAALPLAGPKQDLQKTVSVGLVGLWGCRGALRVMPGLIS